MKKAFFLLAIASLATAGLFFILKQRESMPPVASSSSRSPTLKGFLDTIAGLQKEYEDRYRKDARLLADAFQARDTEARSVIVSGFVPEVNYGEIEALVANVNGFIDRNWRTREWVLRDLVLEVVSPYELLLALHECHLYWASVNLEAIQLAIGKVDTPELLATVRRQITQKSMLCSLHATRSGDSERVSQFYEEASASVLAAIEAGTDLQSIRQALLEHLSDMIKMSMEQNSSPALYDFLDGAPPRDPNLSITEERKRLEGVLIAHVEFLRVEITQAKLLMKFFRTNLAPSAMRAFLESFQGPIDTIRNIAEAGGVDSSKMNSVARSRYETIVMNKEQIDSLEKDYCLLSQLCLSGIFERVSLECGYEISDFENFNVPTADRVDRSRFNPDEHSPHLAGDALRELSGTALDVVDAGLIIGGLLGAPESAGFSLVLTAIGVIHMAGDMAWTALDADARHKAALKLLCISQQAIFDAFYRPHTQDQVADGTYWYIAPSSVSLASEKSPSTSRTPAENTMIVLLQTTFRQIAEQE